MEIFLAKWNSVSQVPFRVKRFAVGTNRKLRFRVQCTIRPSVVFLGEENRGCEMTHGTYGGRCREEGARVRLYTGDLSSAFSPILSCVPLTSPLYNSIYYRFLLTVSRWKFSSVNSTWMCATSHGGIQNSSPSFEGTRSFRTLCIKI